MENNTIKLASNIALSIGLSAALISGATAAEINDKSSHSIGASISSFGPGLFYTYRLQDNLQIRSTLHGISDSEIDTDFNSTSYEGEIDSSSIGIILDWYPMSHSGGWKSKLFVSTGLMAVDTKYDGYAESELGGNLTIGETTVDAHSLNELHLTVENDEITPYFGIGWGNKYNGNSRFSFTSEIGLIYLNEFDVTLTKNDPNHLVNDSDLQIERKNILDDLEGVSGFVSIGMSYHF